MEENKKLNGLHKVSMNNREVVNLTGMIDVLSFDEEVVIGESIDGIIILKGTNLHVNKLDLDNGILEITGHLFSLTYEDNHHMSKNKSSLLSKIFK